MEIEREGRDKAYEDLARRPPTLMSDLRRAEQDTENY
jgi:hypothetical protein